MRLIDANALMKRPPDIHDTYDESGDYDYAHGYTINAIKTAPTVDAVPVVRCKYCKHRPTKPDDYNPITTDGFALEFPDEKCPCKCGDGWYSKYPDDDWYCPIGERKGGVNDAAD